MVGGFRGQISGKEKEMEKEMWIIISMAMVCYGLICYKLGYRRAKLDYLIERLKEKEKE